MRVGTPLNLAGLALAFIVPVAVVQVAHAADESQSAGQVRPILERLCFGCHGPKKQEGEVRLDTLGADAEGWHDALRRINLGEMPPEEAQQPTLEERQRLVEWMHAALRRAAAAKRYAAGRVVTRRLTSYEYQNTMRDLLGVDLDFARDFPPEPASPEGFLNNGATLEMSPEQIETALAAARRGLAEVIVSGEPPQVYRHQAEVSALFPIPQRRFQNQEPPHPEFILDIQPFPRRGEFEIRVTAGATVAEGDDFPRLLLALGNVPGIVHVPRKLVGEVEVTAPLDQPQKFVFRGRIEDFPQPGDREFGNTKYHGMIALIDFLGADGRELRYEDRNYPLSNKNNKKKKKGKKGQKEPQPKPISELPTDRTDIVIRSIEFEAPVFASWPPPTHKAILFESDQAADEPQYVRQVLRRFMSRAFRRPVQDAEVEKTAELFEAIRAHTDSLEEAIRETLTSVLVSPHFLYVVERRDDFGQGEQRIDDYELASRLSYFLWSTMPDDALREAAAAGALHDPRNLEQQVRRMLAEPRSEEFITRWADQWFDLGGLDRVAVNPEVFPDFQESLKDDMRRQTQAFLREILRSDESVLNLLDSNWTMLNRPLAEHYGIAGPRSTEFERVAIGPDGRRGGLLGQSAFLLAGSNGESSHPIKRAVWILDRLLDSPPASPPPDVPALESNSPELAGLTIKQQLEVHRKKASCNSCHRSIDPWGIPLENFDAVGRWRTEIQPPKTKKAKNSAAEPVDASSQLPDGSEITGVAELKQYLLDRRKSEFARSVVRRLAAYSLGRSLDLGDDPEVARLTEHFAAEDYRLSSLIVALVQSDLFQTK
jgi:hypothetical protein